MRYDGNLAFLNDHELSDRRWLESRPLCDDCYEAIQDDHYYDWSGSHICERCATEKLMDLSIEELAEWASCIIGEDDLKEELVDIIKEEMRRSID